MALSANTVWEVRTAGSDTNGGGFVTGSGGTDYSQQNTAQIAVTDAVTNGTTTITSATASFAAAHVGNIIYVAGGTGSIAGAWYQVTSVTNSTTIVVDRSTGLTSGTGATLNLGGALGTPGVLGGLMTVSGMDAWIKAGTYTLTTSTAGSGGPMAIGNVGNLSIRGYDVTRGDNTGNRPVLAWGTLAAPGAVTYLWGVEVSSGGSETLLNNLKADGGSKNNVCGFGSLASRTQVVNCVAANCNGTAGVGFSWNGTIVQSQATSCTTGFGGNNTSGNAHACVASSCGTGFNIQYLFECLASAFTTAGFVALGSSNTTIMIRCTADGNGGAVTGIDASTSGASGVVVNSCIASNCSGVGGNGFKVQPGNVLLNCASYNNTTEINTGAGSPTANIGMILNASFTGGSPWVNQSTGDFRPNATAGAGALLRGAATGVFGQTDNQDIGAVQHTDPSGGGGGLLVHPGMTGGIRG